jgi:hypothetical protein
MATVLKLGGGPGWGTFIALLVIVLVAVGVVTGFIVISGWGNTNTTTTTTTAVTGEQVDLFLMLQHETAQEAPAATPVNFYNTNRAYFGSWTSSSGLVTVTQKMIAGTTMYFQVRAAAPNAAAYATYTTPLVAFTVPHGDVNGDAYIQTDPYLIHETSTSAATFAITDQDNNAVSTEATIYVNDTDTSLNVLVSITTNCDYGTPEDFTDMATGYSYKAGMFLVLKSTATQTLNSVYTHFYSSSLHFYIFQLPMLIRSTNLGYIGSRTFVIDTGTASFTASADFDFDIYDTCQLDSTGAINENSFKNGDSDLNPTAIANKVA